MNMKVPPFPAPSTTQTINLLKTLPTQWFLGHKRGDKCFVERGAWPRASTQAIGERKQAEPFCSPIRVLVRTKSIIPDSNFLKMQSMRFQFQTFGKKESHSLQQNLLSTSETLLQLQIEDQH